MYDGPQEMMQKADLGAICRRPTTRERLVEQKKELETILANINEALAALDSNPEFERVHNLISKVL